MIHACLCYFVTVQVAAGDELRPLFRANRAVETSAMAAPDRAVGNPGRSEGSNETRDLDGWAEGQEKPGEDHEPGTAEARKMLYVKWNSVHVSRGESCLRLVRRGNVRSVPLKKIYVGNLAAEATEQGLGAAFAAFGAVQKVSVVRDRHSGEPRGFGFVEMESSDEADAAIAALNGTQLDGRTLAVNEARSPGVKTA